MKKAIIALLAFGALSAAAIPANADMVTVQDGSQTAVTTGNNNYTGQDSRQHTGNYSQDARDSTGTAQRSDQYSDTYGNSNDTVQTQDQDTRNYSVRTQRDRSAYQ